MKVSLAGSRRAIRSLVLVGLLMSLLVLGAAAPARAWHCGSVAVDVDTGSTCGNVAAASVGGTASSDVLAVTDGYAFCHFEGGSGGACAAAGGTGANCSAGACAAVGGSAICNAYAGACAAVGGGNASCFVLGVACAAVGGASASCFGPGGACAAVSPGTTSCGPVVVVNVLSRACVSVTSPALPAP